MIHPATALADLGGSLGLGLVARQPIAKGTLIWVQDPLDQVLPAQQVAALPALYADLTIRFAYRNSAGDYVLPWDDTRFMNHSCDYNCALTRFEFEIAVRDIATGEPLTNDYAMLNLDAEERIDCECDSSACRGQIGPADQIQQKDRWHQDIRHALTSAHQVEQPLLPLLPIQQLAAAQHYYTATGPARS